MQAKETIGFIGIGRMGYPMAGHLARAGYRVLVWDTNQDAVNGFHAEHGGSAASDIAALARESDVVITMLPTSKIVRDVVLGTPEKPGLAAGMRPGTLVIDTSTSDPHDTRALGAGLAAFGVETVDAPVAGGVVFARDGTLDILVGGADDIVARAEPILRAMGRSCTHCGPLGAAHAMKALNNFVNAAVLTVNLEAIVAGRQFGISEEIILSSLEAATMGRNHPYEKKIKLQVLNRRFASGMAMGLIAKDVSIARDLIATMGGRGPLASCVTQLWRDASDELGFNSDQTEIARYWENAAGVTLGKDRDADG